MREKDLPSIIAEIGFNYDEDKKRFSVVNEGHDRIVDLCGGIGDKGETIISISVVLGNKPDDTISLTFDGQELISKIVQAMVYGEDNSP
ncbi:hypothetical protein LCGC14_0844100 [marine sediment metagenome]|uniref:Uncharacterized protein n=1 Tax=marine sediment metagenome TaxID=412755 RepID=A0A0F9PCA2_9ZZZZ